MSLTVAFDKSTPRSGKVRTRPEFDKLRETAGLKIDRVQDTQAAADCTVLEISRSS
jgi:hypothetical protein